MERHTSQSSPPTTHQILRHIKPKGKKGEMNSTFRFTIPSFMSSKIMYPICNAFTSLLNLRSWSSKILLRCFSLPIYMINFALNNIKKHQRTAWLLENYNYMIQNENITKYLVNYKQLL